MLEHRLLEPHAWFEVDFVQPRGATDHDLETTTTTVSVVAVEFRQQRVDGGRDDDALVEPIFKATDHFPFEEDDVERNDSLNFSSEGEEEGEEEEGETLEADPPRPLGEVQAPIQLGTSSIPLTQSSAPFQIPSAVTKAKANLASSARSDDDETETEDNYTDSENNRLSMPSAW